MRNDSARRRIRVMRTDRAQTVQCALAVTYSLELKRASFFDWLLGECLIR